MNSLVQRKPFLMSLKGSDGCSDVAEPGAFPFPENAFISIPRSRCHLRCFWNPWFSSSERSFLLWRVKCHIMSWSHGRKICSRVRIHNDYWYLRVLEDWPPLKTTAEVTYTISMATALCFLDYIIFLLILVWSIMSVKGGLKKPLKVNSISFSK